MILFITYILTTLSAASLLYTWFNSHLPQLLFTILKYLGFNKNKPESWIIINDVEELGIAEPRSPLSWTEEDWLSYASTSLPLFFGTLLTCKFCLCYHVVLWFNVLNFLFLLFYFNLDLIFSIVILIYSIFSQPILVLLIYALLDRLFNLNNNINNNK